MSQSIKYLHFNSGLDQRTLTKNQLSLFQNRTVAIEVLTANEIKAVSECMVKLAPEHGFSVSLNVGISLVSKKDNYCKAKGREESVKKMKQVGLKVDRVSINLTHIFIDLEPIEGVALTLRLNKRTGFSTVLGNLTRK